MKRRNFIRKSAGTAAFLCTSGLFPGFHLLGSASGYAFDEDPNSYSFNIGKIKCTAVNDLYWKASVKHWFSNAPQDKALRVLAEYHIKPDEDGNLSGSHCPLLVNTGKNLVLIETGTSFGQLIQHLKEVGVEPGDIDTIIFTHAHYDHIGWNTDKEGHLIFPNARYFISRTEWEYWTNEDYLAQLPADWVRGVRKNLFPLKDKLELIEPESEILPGIRALDAAGHTPGQIAVEIESDGHKLIHLADTIHHFIHIEYPEWIPSLTADPNDSVDRMVENGQVKHDFFCLPTRLKLTQRVAKENAMVFCSHIYPIKPGFIKPKGDRFAFEPNK